MSLLETELRLRDEMTAARLERDRLAEECATRGRVIESLREGHKDLLARLQESERLLGAIRELLRSFDARRER